MDYLSYWKPATVEHERGSLLEHAASEQYGTVDRGDTVWLVTVWPGGHLVLIGRIRVDKVAGQEEAERLLGTADVWRATHHIFPSEGTAEPMREVDVSEIAGSLRFESERDRLNISEGRVSAQQLQSMRRLTPQTAEILREVWEEDSLMATAVQEAESVARGGGFGDTELNRAVERAAVRHVSSLLQGEGWTVKSVEAERIGFDLLCHRGDERRHVEVKGVRGLSLGFVITEGELRRAREDPRFRLFVVTNVLVSPFTHSMSGKEAVERFRFVPVAHRAILF